MHDLGLLIVMVLCNPKIGVFCSPYVYYINLPQFLCVYEFFHGGQKIKGIKG